MKVYVEKIIHGGYGLARVEGGAVLIPFAVPGDVLDVSYEREGPRSLGWIKEILEPSPHRIEPRCPVYGLCGGCDFDHMDYESELAAKKEILLEDLKRLAHVTVDCFEEAVSAQSYGYRNHSQFKVDARGNVGFFEKRSHDVVPLPGSGCSLLDRLINGHVLQLRENANFRPGSFRVRSNPGGELYQKGIPGMPDDLYCCYCNNSLKVRFGIDDFFQVNNFLIEVWLSKIRSYLQPEGVEAAADVYCGSGLIGLSVADSVRSVVGIESNGRAVENARFNAEYNGIRNASFIKADAGTGLSSVESADKIIVDPPRAGLSMSVVRSIARLEPRVLVYASCESATFARDAGSLIQTGYTLERVSLVDMFPRTRHFEIVSKFVRSGA